MSSFSVLIFHGWFNLPFFVIDFLSQIKFIFLYCHKTSGTYNHTIIKVFLRLLGLLFA